MKKKLLLGLLGVSAIIGLSACKAKEYTVTVQPNNGTTVDSFVVTENGTITAPANPTKEGYTFDGWYLDANFSTKVDFSTFKVTEDVALYAKWVINTYTVTFNSNGGSEVANATVNYNTTVTLPTAPTKEGYTFVGWYTDEACTNQYTNGKITANTTLYAKWSEDAEVYVVTFETNGGSEIAAINVVEGEAATLPTTNPTKEGHAFDGWYLDEACTQAYTNQPITAATTLYAKWVEVITSYELTFVYAADGVYGAPEAETVTVEIDEDGLFTPTKPADPTNPYAEFAGWYVDAEYTEEFDFSASLEGDTTVYAKWTVSYEEIVTALTYEDINADTLGVKTGAATYKRFTFSNISSYDDKAGILYDMEGNELVSADYAKGGKVIKHSSGTITIEMKSAGTLTFVATTGSSTNLSYFTIDGVEYQLYQKGDSTKPKYNSSADKMYTKFVIEVTEAKTIVIEHGFTMRIAEVSITEALAKSPVESISVAKSETIFLQGRELVTANNLINVNYVNGRVDTVYAEDCTFDTDYDAQTPGVYTVNVKYTKGGVDYETSYEVEVLAPTSIELYTHVQTQDKYMYIADSVYNVGDTLSTSYLTPVYKAKDSKNNEYEFVALEGEYEINNPDLTTTGIKDLTYTSKINSALSVNHTICVVDVDTEQKEVSVVADSSISEYAVVTEAGATFKTIDAAYQYLSLFGKDAQKVLNVAPGTYNEKLYIELPNLTIVGTGAKPEDVVIEAGYYSQMIDVLGHQYSTRGSATMFVTDAAKNFRLENLTVGNEMNTYEEYYALRDAGISNTQAVALYTKAINGIYVNCRFLGYHDTLEVDYNNNYFYNCYIEGRTDFIFGYDANAYFNDCTINTVVSKKNGAVEANGGYIVATNPATKNTAFVFNNCTFTADEEVLPGSVAVARVWGPQTTVIVANSEIGAHVAVNPFTGDEDQQVRYCIMSGNLPGVQSTYIEYNNTGAGAINESQTWTDGTTTYTTVTVDTNGSLVEKYINLTVLYPNWVFENTLYDTYELHIEAVYTGTNSSVEAVNAVLPVLAQWNGTFALPEAPEVAGLVFEGYYLDEACTQALTDAYTITDGTEAVEVNAASIYAKYVDYAGDEPQYEIITNTYSLDLSVLNALADKDTLDATLLGETNAFLTVVESKYVTARVKDGAAYCIENKNDNLTVTFEGTGTLTLAFSSTGGSNVSRIALKAADGSVLTGTSEATLVTEGDEAGSYEVKGTTSVLVSYEITQPGTYTISCPSAVTGRGTRIASIEMVDEIKKEIEKPSTPVEVITKYGWSNITELPANDEVFTFVNTKEKHKLYEGSQTVNDVTYTNALNTGGGCDSGNNVSFIVPENSTAVLNLVVSSGGGSDRWFAVDTTLTKTTPNETYLYKAFVAETDGYTAYEFTSVELQPGTYYINYSNGIRIFAAELAVKTVVANEPEQPEVPAEDPTVISSNTVISFGSEGTYKSIDKVDFSNITISDNGGNNSQVKEGSFTLKVKAGATVTINGYPSYTSYTLGDGTTTTAEITDATYVYVATADVTLTYTPVNGGNNYLYSISVTYPTVIDANTTISFGSEGNYKTVEGLDITNIQIGDNGGDNSQVKNGSLSFNVKAGATVTVNGYPSYTSYTLGDGTTTTAEITDATYVYTATADVTVTITPVSGNNYFYSIVITY